MEEAKQTLTSAGRDQEPQKPHQGYAVPLGALASAAEVWCSGTC